jgi:hypothetical protein
VISGSNLTAAITITAPTGVELSSDNGATFHPSLTLTPTHGTVARTTIEARISASAVGGPLSGKITHTSTGASEQDVTVTGTVNKASPTLLTSSNPQGTFYAGTSAPILQDSAVLSQGYRETGTITFTLFYSGHSVPVDTEVVMVSGNGTYTTPKGYTLPNATVTGLYFWAATYGGDGNNDAASDNNGKGEQATFAGDQVAKNEAAGLGFWAGMNGQALLKTYSSALGNWLASTYSNLFGNLNGATGAQVAAYFILAKNNAGSLNGSTYALALATALDVWVTTTGLGWNTNATGPTKYGFQQGFGGLGLGQVLYDVGSNGAAFGVGNNTYLTVNAILNYLNAHTATTGGSVTSLPTNITFYGGNTAFTQGANNVLKGIDDLGGI